eukprot:NODE_4542_length_1049_cov_107.406048_g4339_i0.p1 GENE.NODE_4542_length_1049_cov_107.406048_g4339_i0~~NODE_4542_length_1049_cov_107.406048_g4339_i0.p1  ORF type:complete len:301 (-),score=46.97 NODE_4542_length_1049_cov_107.406048_g4339_i0:147-983(-)
MKRSHEEEEQALFGTVPIFYVQDSARAYADRIRAKFTVNGVQAEVRPVTNRTVLNTQMQDLARGRTFHVVVISKKDVADQTISFIGANIENRAQVPAYESIDPDMALDFIKEQMRVAADAKAQWHTQQTAKRHAAAAAPPPPPGPHGPPPAPQANAQVADLLTQLADVLKTQSNNPQLAHVASALGVVPAAAPAPTAPAPTNSLRALLGNINPNLLPSLPSLSALLSDTQTHGQPHAQSPIPMSNTVPIHMQQSRPDPQPGTGHVDVRSLLDAIKRRT